MQYRCTRCSVPLTVMRARQPGGEGRRRVPANPRRLFGVSGLCPGRTTGKTPAEWQSRASQAPPPRRQGRSDRGRDPGGGLRRRPAAACPVDTAMPAHSRNLFPGGASTFARHGFHVVTQRKPAARWHTTADTTAPGARARSLPPDAALRRALAAASRGSHRSPFPLRHITPCYSRVTAPGQHVNTAPERRLRSDPLRGRFGPSRRRPGVQPMIRSWLCHDRSSRCLGSRDNGGSTRIASLQASRSASPLARGETPTMYGRLAAVSGCGCLAISTGYTRPHLVLGISQPHSCFWCAA